MLPIVVGPLVTAGCGCRTCLERAGFVEQAEAWRTRALAAARRVDELELEVDRLREALGDMLDTLGEHIEDVLDREASPEFFGVIDKAREVLATEVRLAGGDVHG